MSENYYKILGIEKTASSEEVKLAFRKLAHKHHPDKGGDEAKFKEINEAYQTLSNSDKRTQYDQFGQAPSGTGGFGDYGFGSGGFNVNYGDFAQGGFGKQFNFSSFNKISPFWWIIIIPVGIVIIFLFLLIIFLWLLLRPLFRRNAQ